MVSLSECKRGVLFHTPLTRLLHHTDNQYSKYVFGYVSLSGITPHFTPHRRPRKIKRQGNSIPCLDPRLTILDVQVDVVGLFQVADEALITFLLQVLPCADFPHFP